MGYGMRTTCYSCGEEFMLDENVIHNCRPYDAEYSMTPDETLEDKYPRSGFYAPDHNIPDMSDDPITNAVIEKYVSRSEAGMKKYGVTLEENAKGLMFWLRNLQEELMDATVYIERTMQELRDMMKDD